MMKRTIAKMIVLASLTAVAMTANAAPSDVKITIDRAINSPTLVVRYSGANAALIEMRLNGASYGTRTSVATKASGESTFTLNYSDLKDGENEIEVRLFDRTGKPVGTEKFTILAEQTVGAPVYLSQPTVGQSVMGVVDIKIGFNAALNSSYVSFFVNDQFKGMTNYPPYSFTWDTTKEKNGWHEIEAWAVDAGSNTFKTRKIKVFVNNPGGRTDREGYIGLEPVKNPVGAPNATGAGKGLRSNATGTTAAGAKNSGVVPQVKATTTAASTAKPATASTTVASGPKMMVPTGNRNAKVTPLPKPVATTKPAPKPTNKVDLTLVATKDDAAKAAPAVRAAVGAMRTAALLKINKGTKLPNVATFAVLMNDKFVEFDVAPRVDGGVPMTPFRHLFESAGGEVKWENLTKSVTAKADGTSIFILIGDPNAKVNELSVKMETTPYLDRGRTIVPVSFLRDALKVEIEYDKDTNHVLITSVKK